MTVFSYNNYSYSLNLIELIQNVWQLQYGFGIQVVVLGYGNVNVNCCLRANVKINWTWSTEYILLYTFVRMHRILLHETQSNSCTSIIWSSWVASDTHYKLKMETNMYKHIVSWLWYTATIWHSIKQFINWHNMLFHGESRTFKKWTPTRWAL